MPRSESLVGRVFAHLTVLALHGRASYGSLLWRCRCVCGTETTVATTKLVRGLTRSCGCRQFENIGERKVKHGMARRGPHSNRAKMAPEYNAWRLMIRRCTNPNDSQWGHYGGRGIKVCDRWLQDVRAFVADVGERPSSRHSLDRYPDNNGNYEPGNVRWATASEQAKNRRTSVILEMDGKRMNLKDWAESSGIQATTISRRVRSGMTLKQALTTPLRKVAARRGQ